MSNKSGREVLLWQDEQIIPLLTGLSIAEGTAEYAQLNNTVSSTATTDYNPAGIPLFSPVYPSTEMQCSCCKIDYATREQLLQHYSGEWHKFNIKRTSEFLQPLSLEHYESPDRKERNDDESSCAADDEPCEEEQGQFRRTPRIYFKNVDGAILSIYRTLLLPPKTLAETEQQLITRAHCCHRKLYWVIVLISGGDFAAAVFNGSEVIVNKSHHCYTVRAGQGGSQSSHDNRKGRNANSAGAALRRHNEKNFEQRVQEILCEWKEHFEKCDLIFHRSPQNCRHLLFGGKSALLDRRDFRLRTIPFSTKRTTFTEVKTIQHELAKVTLHDLEDFKLLQQAVYKKPPTVKKKLPEESSNALQSKQIPDVEEQFIEEESVDEELICELQEVNFCELEEYGFVQTINSDEDDQKAGSKDKIPLDLVNFVFNACIKGNLLLLSTLRQCSTPGFVDEEGIVPLDIQNILLSKQGELDILQIRFGPHKKTILHVAAENSKKHIMWWLMEQGCDPGEMDSRSKVPYSVAPNKAVRDHFRLFMNEYPIKYDYKQAKIPSPLTKGQQEDKKRKQNEKKIAHKKAIKMKEIEIKKIKEDAVRVEKEKQRFSELPEREKRAMAAERRLLASGGITVHQPCHFCNADMMGKVPFSFNDLNFCSTTCVKQQRNRNKECN